MKEKSRFTASADGLLKLLSEATDDSMLQKIAEANYEWEAELHLEALLPIRDEARVPVPMEWHPLEVLNLISWSEPDDPHWKPGETERVGHIIRAFLLRGPLEGGWREQGRRSPSGRKSYTCSVARQPRHVGARISGSGASFPRMETRSLWGVHSGTPVFSSRHTFTLSQMPA